MSVCEREQQKIRTDSVSHVSHTMLNTKFKIVYYRALPESERSDQKGLVYTITNYVIDISTKHKHNKPKSRLFGWTRTYFISITQKSQKSQKQCFRSIERFDVSIFTFFEVSNVSIVFIFNFFSNYIYCWFLSYFNVWAQWLSIYIYNALFEIGYCVYKWRFLSNFA